MPTDTDPLSLKVSQAKVKRCPLAVYYSTQKQASRVDSWSYPRPESEQTNYEE